MQLNVRHYAQAWYDAVKEAKKTGRDEVSLDYLRNLQRGGKLPLLDRIVKEMERIEDKEAGRVAVHVTVAHEMEEKKIKESVQEFVEADDIRLTIETDPSLIGGMTIETEDTRYDLSVRGQLNQLKESIV